MKKKTILGIVLSISLLVVSIIATTITAIAVNPKNTAEKTFYATIGSGVLQLPSNATYPAKAGGTPNHPTVLRIAAFDGDRRSTDGSYDQLMVFMWDPREEQFTPVLLITDNPSIADFMKKVYNNTYIWYPTPPPLIPMFGPNLFPNVVLVQPNELEVWTESSQKGYGNGPWSFNDDTLTVNLTKSVKSTLGLFIINASLPQTNPARFANATFNLPPLTLIFHELDKGYPNQDTTTLNWPGSSGY